MTEQNRLSREMETRAKSGRPKQWMPPETLPSPNEEPGYVFRWVATHILGEATPSNVSKKLREGWEPVKAEDHPELMLQGNKDGNVEVGGLMLCKIPTERLEARKAYYEKQTEDQINSVDNHFMRNNDARMPLFSDRNTTTTKGRGFGNGSK